MSELLKKVETLADVLEKEIKAQADVAEKNAENKKKNREITEKLNIKAEELNTLEAKLKPKKDAAALKSEAIALQKKSWKEIQEANQIKSDTEQWVVKEKTALKKVADKNKLDALKVIDDAKLNAQQWTELNKAKDEMENKVTKKVLKDFAGK